VIATLIALPVLGLVLMLQTIVVSSLPMLSGYADLVLLVLVAWALKDRGHSAWIWSSIGGLAVGIISAQPLLVPVTGYLLVTAIARLVRRRVWQTPILTMFLLVFVGSLITQGLLMGVLIFLGTSLPVMDSINLVVLPGTLLNLLLALPVYALIADLAQWLYPEEVEV
jgi:rod shape-determining protein MreD